MPKEVLETFLFVNKHNKKSEELKDWSYWKDKLEIGIPVFYRFDEKQNVAKDFGLTFMYKQPVLTSVSNLLDYKGGKDLSEIMFGSVRENDPLKGRVFISHLWAKESKELQERSFVLASPKSSFTPFYLQQEGKDGKAIKFNTYNTASILRGFKRYPVHSAIKSPSVESTNSDMTSKYKPLDKGVIFEGKVRFHNLRRIEIGALVSAITFHNTPGTFHSIGALKPFGYGRIKVEIDRIEKFDHHLREFELKMRARNNSLWVDRLIELTTMASVQKDDASLGYMALNEFQIVKNEGKYLKKYSEIVNSKNSVRFLCTNDEVASEIERQTAESRAIEYRRKSAKNKADTFFKNDDFKNARISYTEYKSFVPDFDLASTIQILEDQEMTHVELQGMLLNPSVEILNQFRSRYPNSKWDREIENMIVEIRLNNKKEQAEIRSDEKLIFQDKGFNAIKTKLNDFLKNKQFKFSITQIEAIISVLKESYNLDRGNKKSDWNKNSYPKYPWSDISKWIGEDQAKALHAELNK